MRVSKRSTANERRMSSAISATPARARRR
jgi:hypothetical protein